MAEPNDGYGVGRVPSVVGGGADVDLSISVAAAWGTALIVLVRSPAASY